MESALPQTFTASWDAGGNPVDYQEPWGEAGAFTTLRLDVGRTWRCPYLFELHMDRLFSTFEQLGWALLFKREFVESAVKDFVNTIPDEGSYSLRVMMSDVVLSVRAARREEPADQQYGYLWDYTRENAAFKTLDYTDVLTALKGINRRLEELLLVSEDERLLEGATSCLLFYHNGQLVVPQRDRLDSITMKFLLERLGGICEVVERDVYLGEVKEFDEILLCGTGKGIVSLTEIEELEWKCRSLSFYRRARITYDNALIDYKYQWM